MKESQSPTGPHRPVSFSGGEQVPREAADLDPHWKDLSLIVERAEQNRAEMARLHADRAELCAEALKLVALRTAQRHAARPGREIGDTIPLREVMAELACALRVGERTVSIWLGDGAALVHNFPATLEALRTGRIDERHASAIIDAGMPLDEAIRPHYEELVLTRADVATAPELREIARVIAAHLQPDITEQRQRDALAQRQVKTYALQDGLSRLLLDAPAALVQGIFERVTDMAVALNDADTEGDGLEGDGAEGDESDPEERDDRTLDQRRADIMCDLLLSGAPAAHGDSGLAAIRATVQVTIPILTLAGLDDAPAILDGHGPIDAETARILAAAAESWQRVMIHPVTAEPLRLDSYPPSKRLRRLLDARDRCCRWPGCRRQARRSDADHTIAFSEGGKTHAGNLEILCRRHHRLKHASPWVIEHLGGGTLLFTSPTRRKYRNDAPPVLEAVTEPPWARLLATPYDPADGAGF
ncbi:HNH endonuclease signature motif containing protein [Microbacterium memoriense]|uniref:HNH endonuclease n=1 Tax=Microbacterium memoriense TaxID=2978350 RepID=A0ABT2PFT9_9MICO|nr:HNH endonuclease signature motif containing protein [Microbacterium memoriense]MCT9003052.1 HNH endonuclease [Microbacterium memoriense]